MTRIAIVVVGLALFSFFGLLAWMTISGETAWVLYPYAVIWLAHILAGLWPGRGPGHFAMTHQFGPVRRAEESESAWQLRLSGWWFSGALVLPFSLSVVWLSDQQPLFGTYTDTVMPLFVVPLPVLGFACFLKCMGSLFKAARSSPVFLRRR
jgi:hypothetical protein